MYTLVPEGQAVHVPGLALDALPPSEYHAVSLVVLVVAVALFAASARRSFEHAFALAAEAARVAVTGLTAVLLLLAALLLLFAAVYMPG